MLVIILFILLTVIFCAPIIMSGNNLGIQDWDQQFAYLETARRTVLEYKQFPFWNPYHCGGMPGFGNPQSNIISITFLLVLLFGTVIGVKISILVHYFIGLLGFYYLTQYFNLSKPARIFSSLIFIFSGVLSSAIATGMIPFLPMSYFPWIWFFLLKSEQKGRMVWKHILITSIIMALSYYESYHSMIIFLPLLCLFLVFRAIKNKKSVYIRQLLLISAFFVLFSTPKMILNVELMNTSPRKILVDNSGYSFSGLIYFLTSKNQNIHNNLAIRDFNWGVDENSLYVGYIPLLLFVIGIVKYWRKKKEYFFSLVLIFILMIESGGFISLFSLLKKLPFYDSFRVAQRFRIDFIFMFSIFTALGTEFFIKKKPFKKNWPTLLIVLVYIDLLIFSYINFFTKSFIIKNPEQKTTKKQPIKQIAGYNADLLYDKNISLNDELKDTIEYSSWGAEYPATRDNVGTRDCYEAVPIGNNVRSYEDKNYRGEFYLSNKNGNLGLKEWSPNKIIFETNIEFDTSLIVNQNYSNKWVVFIDGKKQPARNLNGLISIPLKKGDKTIIFEYRAYGKN